MSISHTMSNALSGLTASSRRAEITSNNISNALTEGYARREVVLGEATVAGRGAGVRVAGVERASDPALTASRRDADGDLAGLTTRADALGALADSIGAVEDPDSLFAHSQAFETALRTLAETPESETSQLTAAAAGSALTQSFTQISTEARDIRTRADHGIAGQVDDVNDALHQIEIVSRDINSLGAAGRDSSALEDERQRLIDQVSQAVPVRTIRQEGGNIALMTPGGSFLFNGTAAKLAFTPTNIVTEDLAYSGGTGALSGLTLNGRDITPGSGDTQAITGGSLAALFEVRDQIVPAFTTQMDGLARDLVERFQDPAVDPTLLPGQAGLFTDAGAPFNPLAEAGLAGRLSFNAAVDPAQGGEARRMRDGVASTAPGPSGDGTIARSLLDAFTAARSPTAATGLTGMKSASAAAAGLTGLRAGLEQHADSETATGAARAQTLRDAQTQVSGVDTDQELQQLIQIEQSYAANAKVIQVAGRLIDKLMEI